MNKKEYVRNRKDIFEVIVTHNPPQILGRYDVQEFKWLIEIKEKNGSSVKTVTWVDKGEDKKENNGTINEYKEEPTFFEYIQSEVANTCQKVVSYSTDAYEESKIHLGHTGDELYRVSIYAEHQLSVGHDLVRDYINYWAPIVWEKILDFTTTTIESVEEGYLKTKEVVLEGIFNLRRSIKDQYDEIYTSF